MERFQEFEQHKTREAKFAQCVDCIEAFFFGVENDPEVYLEKWDEEVARRIYSPRFDEFPELMPFFNDMIKYYKEAIGFGK